MIGIDEAGRGAWAGPLVSAGCIIVGVPAFLPELRDSKVLSKKNRERLYTLIAESCNCHVAVIEPKVVDEIGLTAALSRAAVQIADALPKSEPIVIDGNYNFLKDTEHSPRVQTLVKADAIVPEVMAASIIAKVTRDRIMQQMDTTFPGYGFAQNVGYGTAKHLLALKVLGVTNIHRLSYRPVAAILLSKKNRV